MYSRTAYMPSLTLVFRPLMVGLLVAAILLNATIAQAKCMPGYIGNASISLASPLKQTVAGANVGFTASIRDIGGRSLALVAQVVGPDGSILERSIVSSLVSEGDVAFAWKVPTQALNGMYTVNAILVPAEASYGSAFSDTSLPWASMPIAVGDGFDQTVHFSAGDVIATPHADGSVSLAALVVNDTTEPYKGMVTWRVYSGIGTVGETPILEKSTELKIHPRSSANMEYIVPNATLGTYYVEVKAHVLDGRQVSIVDTWIENGVAVGMPSCGDSGSADTAQLWNALGLLIVVGAAVFIWKRVRKNPLIGGRNN